MAVLLTLILYRRISVNIYTGYVYLWFDTKAKLYYLGGHQGLVQDSYVCSSEMMLRAYNKRPNTFKFKVLEYVNGGLNDLRDAEQRWLDLIKDTELYWTPNIQNNTVRYYNQKKLSRGGSRKGHTKNRVKPGWNKGYSKVEIELRSNGLLSFVPLDYPKSKKKKEADTNRSRTPSPRIPKILHTKECPVCNKEFNTYKEKQKTCSRSCSGKITWLAGTAIPGFKKGNQAWNKGMPNPTAADNGRRGSKKQSNTVTGRTLVTAPDGSRHWVYPNR